MLRSWSNYNFFYVYDDDRFWTRLKYWRAWSPNHQFRQTVRKFKRHASVTESFFILCPRDGKRQYFIALRPAERWRRIISFVDWNALTLLRNLLLVKYKDRQQFWVSEVRNTQLFTSYRCMNPDTCQVISSDDFQIRLIRKRIHHYPENIDYYWLSMKMIFLRQNSIWISKARSMIQKASYCSYSM